jgi:hypothetical protein
MANPLLSGNRTFYPLPEGLHTSSSVFLNSPFPHDEQLYPMDEEIRPAQHQAKWSHHLGTICALITSRLTIS